MRTHQLNGMTRSRWAAIGAAVAVTFGVGGLAITHAANPTGSSGFVPIAPCRLLDTRPATAVGARVTPINAGETFVQQVTGAVGGCTVPADAAGVALNVTVVDGTASSFLTVWPSDTAQPTASNLNWSAGQAAVPNKVDVKLSADGKVSLFNFSGSVDVIADVVGFYAVIDTSAPATTPSVTTAPIKRVFVDQNAFSNDGESGLTSLLVHDFSAGSLTANNVISCGNAGIQLPNGATVTNLVSRVQDDDNNPGADVKVQLWRNDIGVGNAELMAQATTSGTPSLITLTTSAITEPVVDNTGFSYSVTVCGLQTSGVKITKFFDVFVNLA